MVMLKKINNTSCYIGDDGNVYNRKYKELSKIYTNGGYVITCLYRRDLKKTKCYLIHRLVCEYFLDNFDKNLSINHINEIKSDNRISNLECISQKLNNSKYAGEYLEYEITNIETGEKKILNTHKEVRLFCGFSKGGGVQSFIKRGYNKHYKVRIITTELYK